MTMPQLWSEDLPGVVRWIKAFLASPSEPTESAADTATYWAAGDVKLRVGDVEDGWLETNGAYAYRDEDAALFAAIGLVYEPSAGALVFRLPNYAAPDAHSKWVIKR
jgi:hypothetical protein